jgi:hypothetical protein
LLRDGKVLAAGGFGNRSILSSAELFDPVAGAWTFTGSMHDVRFQTAAALLPNGKVLVAGGSTNVSSVVPIRTAELYDPATGTWTYTGSMSQERWEFTLTLLTNGNVMAAGGSGTNGPVASVELYDPATGVWTPTGPLQTPRASQTATLLPNGKVLVAGGTGPDPIQSSTHPVDPVLASAELYDPITGTWTPTGSMGQPRQAHTATLLPNGKVLVAGGISFFGSTFPTSAELYDPATEKWSPTIPLVSGRQDHFTTLLPNGKVLVAGGFNSSDTGPSTELFDPATIVPTPFRLADFSKQASGAVQFNFRNTPGLNFSVLSATNFAIPASNWANLGSAAEISPGHYHFTDASAIGVPQQFYQARSQ